MPVPGSEWVLHLPVQQTGATFRDNALLVPGDPLELVEIVPKV